MNKSIQKDAGIMLSSVNFGKVLLTESIQCFVSAKIELHKPRLWASEVSDRHI